MVAIIVGIPGLLDMIGKQILENLKNFGITLQLLNNAIDFHKIHKITKGSSTMAGKSHSMVH